MLTVLRTALFVLERLAGPEQCGDGQDNEEQLKKGSIVSTIRALECFGAQIGHAKIDDALRVLRAIHRRN
jgi:hypothetical protein